MSNGGAEPGALRERLLALSQVMQAFAEATNDADRLFAAVADRMATMLHCACAVLVLSDDGARLDPVAVHDADPAALALSRETLLEPLVLEGHPIARQVLETRRALVMAIDLEAMRPPRTTPRYFELLEQLGTHSMLIVPLVARGEVLGALVLTRHAGWRAAFDESDLDLARDVAEHAALAMSNARALASESAARAEAETARERARASERAVRTFFEASPVPSFVFDQEDQRLLGVNDAALALYGYTRDEFLALSLDDLRLPEEATALGAALVNAGEQRIASVGMHRRKDGTVVTVESQSHVGTLDGRRARFVALRDVGERLRAETAIEQLRTTASSEATFRALIEAAPDAVVIVDREGTIVLVNAEAERLFGYARDELVGRPVELVVPARARLEHDRARRAYLADPKRRRMGSGLELFARRKDGSEVPVEVSLSPIETPQGLLVKSAIRDITDRKRAETKFRALLESAPDAKVITDAEGRIAIVNARTEAMFGYGRDELLGQPVEMLIPAAARERHAGHRTVFFTDPKARPMGKGLSLRAVRKDGSEFPVEISLSPLETEDGLLVSSAIRDVTDREAMEEALRVANRELEAFSYSVAHDLRAPLRAVHGFAQILLEDFGDGARPLDDDGRDCLREVNENAVRMGELIDGLLSLSRVARTEVRPVVVDLAAAAHRVARDLARAEPAREVAFAIEPRLDARVDPRLAENLVENLVGNAWKFTRAVPGARIEVGRSPAHASTFFVRDNGAGFDMRYADKLFGAFQRLHQTSEFPGTGIGLATVQRIVHRHGGRVWAEGAVGAGATFYFTLPVV